MCNGIHPRTLDGRRTRTRFQSYTAPASGKFGEVAKADPRRVGLVLHFPAGNPVDVYEGSQDNGHRFYTLPGINTILRVEDYGQLVSESVSVGGASLGDVLEVTELLLDD